MGRKIVLIGAGSAVFTAGLVADLLQAQEAQQGRRQWELGLVDIDAPVLETVTRLVERMMQAREMELPVQASTDRCDVLPGADVVVTTIAVGGRRAWEADVFIPRRHGIFQPVGDTVMPGGVSRALRMIPALVEIARDVARLCPGARFINYSNPMTANCRAIRRATDVPVIGLCHGVFHVERELARFAGIPPSEVSSLAVGVNHLTFFLDLRRKGQDAWPLVRARLAAERNSPDPAAGTPTQAGPPAPQAADNPFAWSLFESYGAYPAVNDRHVVEFFPERFPSGEYYGRKLGVDAFSFERTIENGDRGFANMREQAEGRQPLPERLLRRAAGEHEQLLDILAAIDTDTRRIYSVNLPNGGAIPGLPAEAVLELPAAATARGLQPLQFAEFPAPLAAILNRRIAAQELTVEAALTGDRRLFVEALLADGAVTEPNTAVRLADDFLAAHRVHLPQFG
jgi:alpha-galactosidase